LGFAPTFSYTGFATGDTDATLSNTGAAYDFSHVATASKVTVSGLALSAITGTGLTTDYALSANSKFVAATITTATLTPTLTNTSVTKTYNATTAAPVGFAPTFSYTGFATGDTDATLTNTGAVYDFSHVATATKVTVSGLALSAITGTGLTTDYALSANSKFVAATITTATLTPTLTNTSVTKTYNATTAAPVGFTPTFSYTGFATGDTDATLTNTGAAYDFSHVATATKVTVTGLALSAITGTGFTTDYALSANSKFVAATITTATLTPTLTNTSVTKTYNATTAAPVGFAPTFSFTGFVTGDTNATLSNTGAAYDFSHVATASRVTVSGLGIATITGTGLATDYSLSSNSNSTPANITPATLTYTANLSNRLYGAAKQILTGKVTGFAANETLATATTGSAVFSSTATVFSNVGSYNITGSGLTANFGNYTFAQAAANNTALTINKALLTVTASNKTKTYGATQIFTGTSFTSTGLANSDTIGSVSLVSDGSIASAGVTGGPYAIIPSTANGGSFDASNYTINYVNGKLTVTRAVLEITADSTSKVFGDSLSFNGSEFSSIGLKNGESIGTVSLASSGSIDTASVAGGPYAITASAAAGGNFDATNYSISYVPGTLNITAIGLLGITANSVAKTYDGLAFTGGNGVKYSGFRVGDTAANSLTGTISYGGTSQNAINAGTYSIIPGGQSPINSNYTLSYVNGTLKVSPASLNIEADSKTRLYGAANPLFSATYTGLVNGDTAAALGGTLVISTLAEPGSNVGNYAIVPSGQSSSNYTIDYVSGDLSISPTHLTISANELSKNYGASDPALTFETLGLENGDLAANVFSGALTRSSGESVSETLHTITQGNLAANNNYIVSSFTDSTLAITPRAVTITASAGQNKIYGNADPVSFTYTHSDLGAGIELSGTLDRVSGENTGSYAINQGTLTDANNSNYLLSYAGNNFAITPKTLIVSGITVSNKTYDGTSSATANTDMALYSGLVSGDAISISSTASFADKNVAHNKTVLLSNSYAGAALTNYSITDQTNTTANITPRTLTISATAENKVYDGLTHAVAQLTDDRLANDVLVINGSADFSDTYTGNNKTVVVNSITLTGTDSANYNFNTQTSSTANITAAPLEIKVNNATRQYGTVNPSFDATYVGLQNGETPFAIDGTLAISTSAIPGSNVGDYSLTASGQNSINYAISYTPGSFSITPAPLIVTANIQSKVFGTTDPALTFTTQGLISNPALGVVNTQSDALSGVLSRTSGESVLGGPYTINQGTLAANNNYSMNFVSNRFLITTAPLEPHLGGTAAQLDLSGFVNNQTYFRNGGFWHISLNPNNADVGFDVGRGENSLKSRLEERLDICGANATGGSCETW
ncbi:MAG: MBG domain-containing protein, partial [Gallionellaceae bacterium]